MSGHTNENSLMDDGLRYEQGNDVPRNLVTAARYYQQALQRGNANARNELQRLFNDENVSANDKYLIGVMFANADGVVRNYNEALRWIQEARNHSCAAAYWSEGRLYEYGNGVQRNVLIAATRYLQAIQRGCVEAQADLDHLFEREGISAQDTHSIAILCHNGIAEGGVEQLNPNYVEALRWYQKAIIAGSAVAYRNLGLLFNYGYGVPRNVVTALRYYRLSLQNGYAQAQGDVDRLFNDNQMRSDDANLIGALFGNATNELPVDYVQAIRWYEKAQRAGSALACRNLSFMNENARGMPRNFLRAAKLYQKAISRGWLEARNDLERLLASEQITLDESYRIAFMYHRDEEIEVDYAIALRWYLKAARGGSHEAYRMMAIIYSRSEDNRGIEKNIILAAEYFLAAIRAGNVHALEELCCTLLSASVAELSQILLKSVMVGNVDVVRALIKTKAHLNVQDDNGNTPLHLTIINRRFDIANILFTAGASFRIKNMLGNDVLSLLRQINEIEFVTEAKNLLASMLYSADRENYSDKSNIFYRDLSRRRNKIAQVNERYNKRWRVISENIFSSKRDYLIERDFHENSLREMSTIFGVKTLLKIVFFGVLGLHDLRVGSNGEIEPLQILVDPDRGDLDTVSFGTVPNAHGVYYGGRGVGGNIIYIGGQRSVQKEESHLLARGTLIHEFAHFVMNEVFKNNCDPYFADDEENRNKFEVICQRVRRVCKDSHPLIQQVFNYPEWHRELIVRVPQLLAMSRIDVFEKEGLRELLEYYYNVVLPACKQHLGKLRERNWVLKSKEKIEKSGQSIQKKSYDARCGNKQAGFFSIKSIIKGKGEKLLIGVNPVTNLPIYFREEMVLGNGHCGFTTLGATREQVVDVLLPLAVDEAAREALWEEIFEAFETNNLQRTADFEALYRDLHRQNISGEERDQAHLRIVAYCKRENVFRSYINAYRGNLWLGYKSALLYAQMTEITVYVWRKTGESQRIEIIGANVAEEPRQLVHMFLTQGYTHYNLLVEVPELTLNDDSTMLDQAVEIKSSFSGYSSSN